ncbi:MAG: hypothetical protein RLZZ264_291, partial [Bacillota bacterium]
ATNDSHYINEVDANAHDILLCVSTQAKNNLLQASMIL